MSSLKRVSTVLRNHLISKSQLRVLRLLETGSTLQKQILNGLAERGLVPCVLRIECLL